MKIALTGGTGFIGRNFIKSYAAPINTLTRKILEEMPSNVKKIEGDLESPNHQSFLKDCDVLIHLACSLTPRTSQANIEEEMKKNYEGTLRIFEQFKQAKPSGKIIFFSSGGALYDNSNPKEKTENDILIPTTKYGLLKMQIESHLNVMTRDSELKAISLRVSNPYGEIFSSNRKQGFIGVALKSAVENLPLTIFENKNTVRDYIHFEDLNSLLNILVTENEVKAGEHRIYNVGSGVGTSLEALVHIIEDATNRNISKTYINQELAPTFNTLSISKICNDFQWKPQTPLLEGIRKSLLTTSYNN